MKTLNHFRSLILTIFVILTTIIIFGIYFSPTAIGFDENYTLALINHSYHNIIYLDSMDVHPILYYFLLKSFINVTTFWTSNFLAKIMSARIFSLIISIFTFVFLRKILNELHIRNNTCLEWIIFLILPGVLNSSGVTDSQLITVRMYGLASLFIVAEVFNLLKYDMTKDHKYIIFSTILAICAAYTHYYAAIFSGLLLLIYFIKTLIRKNTDFKWYFLSGVILLLCYLPWIPVFLKQASNPYTYWISNSVEIKQGIRFIVLLLIFLFPIYEYYKQSPSNLLKSLISNIVFTLVPTFMVVFIYSFINHPMFEVRYMLPILVIYEFLSVNIVLKYLLRNKLKTIGIIILVLCFVGSFRTLKTQYHYQMGSIYVFNKYYSNNTQVINKYSIRHCAGGILSDMLYNNKHIIIPKVDKKSFKEYINIFYHHNPTYARLFKSEIHRMKFR